MNQVYYGNHAYGIEAAAQTYFSKHASELTLPEAALLAGLPQAPSAYDPFRTAARSRCAPQRGAARDARTRATSRATSTTWAVKRRLGLKPGKLYTTIREPYFFSYVRDQLIAEYGASDGASRRAQGLHDDRSRASSAPRGRRSRRR